MVFSVLLVYLALFFAVGSEACDELRCGGFQLLQSDQVTGLEGSKGFVESLEEPSGVFVGGIFGKLSESGAACSADALVPLGELHHGAGEGGDPDDGVKRCRSKKRQMCRLRVTFSVRLPKSNVKFL